MSDVGTDRGQAAMRIVIGVALLGFVLLDGSSTHYMLHSDGPDTTAGTEDDLQSAGSWVPDP